MTELVPPPLKNDCFSLPSGVTWTPVDEALAGLRDRLRVVTATETIAATETLDRILAADVVAPRANPPQPNSAVDGYGMAHAAINDGANQLPLLDGRSAAGQPYSGTVPLGRAIRILTGATIPEGVDTVILQEDATTDGRNLAFNGPMKHGANTRRAGEDVGAGATILPRQRRITPADIALMAATGVAEVVVHKPLRVAVISTGDELAEPGTTAAPDQIYDANRPMLLAMARKLGFEAVDMGRVPDDRTALRAALDVAATKADVILTSGGASAGDEDHVSALLAASGSLAFWRIAIKPGRPLALAMWQGTPIFGLPGNPVAALVTALVFGRPAMGLLAGEGWRQPEPLILPAAFTKSKKAGRREFQRARIRNGAVEVFASEGSGRISGLSWAEGLLDLSHEAQEITPGTPVRFLPYGAFGL